MSECTKRKHAHGVQRCIASLGPVVMRDWIESDVDGYAELVADPMAMRYISDGKTRGRRQAQEEIDRFRREISTRGWSRFALARREDNRFAGYVGFQEVDGEIDYGGRLLRDFWRCRFGPLSYCLALEYGFDTIGFNSLFATVHPENQNALSLTRTFFGVDGDRLIEGRFGPLKRFDLSRDRFHLGLREENRKFMKKAARLHLEINAQAG